jgi:hypothetical protein
MDYVFTPVIHVIPSSFVLRCLPDLMEFFIRYCTLVNAKPCGHGGQAVNMPADQSFV